MNRSTSSLSAFGTNSWSLGNEHIWYRVAAQGSLDETAGRPKTRILACTTLSIEEKGLIQAIVHKLKALIKWLREALYVTTRSLEIAARFSPLLILTPASVLTKSPDISNYTWSYVLKSLQALGPAFVKFSQW